MASTTMTMTSSSIIVESESVNKDVLLLQLNGSSALVCVAEGRVISWKNNCGEELLFCASKDRDRPMLKFIANTLVQACDLRFFSIETEASRTYGGTSTCFPKVSNDQHHGRFATPKLWSLDSNPPPPPTNTEVYVDLIMTTSIEDLEIWPHSSEFRLRIMLDPRGDLLLTSRVKNIDTKEFTFEFAYQNYVKVSDISDVRVEGLGYLHYLDNTKKQDLGTEQHDAITFEQENFSTGLLSASSFCVLSIVLEIYAAIALSCFTIFMCANQDCDHRSRKEKDD